jgi:hypothetical protein
MNCRFPSQLHPMKHPSWLETLAAKRQHFQKQIRAKNAKFDFKNKHISNIQFVLIKTHNLN